MTKRGFLGVALRAMGVWLLLLLVLGVLSSLGVILRLAAAGRGWTPNDSPGETVLVSIAVVVGMTAWATAGVFLFLKGASLASWIARDAAPGPLPADDTLHRRLFGVMVRILGLIYVVRLLHGVLLWMPATTLRFDPHWSDWPTFITGVLSLAVAVFLLFGAALLEQIAFPHRPKEVTDEAQ